jgi:hypothetical protein
MEVWRPCLQRACRRVRHRFKDRRQGAEPLAFSTSQAQRRFTRLTNAFSKKGESHAHSVAIHPMHYNFVRIHQTLRCAPAMEAGVSKTRWELADMVKVLEEWEATKDA